MIISRCRIVETQNDFQQMYSIIWILQFNKQHKHWMKRIDTFVVSTQISYDWLLSRRDLYHSWWAISPIYTTVVKDAIRRLQYPYPNLFLYLMLCFSFIPNRVIPLLFNLNNIYLENNQNIQYFKQSKYRQDSETSNYCFYKSVS